MKRIYIVSVVLLGYCFQLTGNQDGIDSLFSNANNLYKQKDFFEAIESYQSVISQGYKSPELFFNLGNAYFKTGNYPMAILNYERAKLLDPSDDDIELNLAKSQTYIVDKINSIPELFIISWINGLLGLLSSNSWAVLSVILFIIALVVFLFYFLIKAVQIKKISFFAGIIFMLFTVLSFLAAKRTKSLIENSRSAIVLEQIVRVKSSPDTESSDMFVIHEGTKVMVIREVDDWSEIKLADGKQGWMETEDFEKI
jgi:tetratricopeptide (TPR) repeat protein